MSLKKKRHFESIPYFKKQRFDYVNCFNTISVHGTFGYVSSREYKYLHIKETVYFSVDIATSFR
ncbi:IS3 family transposase [Peribacillus muralis]|uniref:IS3 family transposase n=1 Tax=Peribacillus muralis TaxID=264697 RepID=UPI00349F040B